MTTLNLKKYRLNKSKVLEILDLLSDRQSVPQTAIQIAANLKDKSTILQDLTRLGFLHQTYDKVSCTFLYHITDLGMQFHFSQGELYIF